MMPFLVYMLLGTSFLWGLEQKPGWPAFLALSLLAGTGLLPLLMFVMDLLQISLVPIHIYIAATLLSLFFYYIYRRKAGPSSFDKRLPEFTVWINLVLVGIILSIITWKAIYWPPVEFDTILGYDFLARAISKEQTLHHNILLNRDHIIASGPRFFYPPLTALNMSWWYLNGYLGKNILILWNLGFVISIYALLTKVHGRAFLSSLILIFLYLTPEWLAHTALALTNYPTAVFSGMGLFILMIGLKQRLTSWIYYSFWFFGFAVFTRSDALLLLPALLLLLFWRNAFSLRERVQNFLYMSIPVFIYICWNGYVKQNLPLTQESFFINHFFWDADKFAKIWSYAFELWTSTDVYGVTFYVFASVIMLEWIFKKSDFPLLLYILTSLFLYTMVYYLISDVHGTLFEKPGGWMPSGYKRGMFVFVVWAWYYIGRSRLFTETITISQWASKK